MVNPDMLIDIGCYDLLIWLHSAADINQPALGILPQIVSKYWLDYCVDQPGIG